MLLKDLGYEIIFTNLQNFLGMWNIFKMSGGVPLQVIQGADSTRFAACVRWNLCTVNVQKKTPLDAPWLGQENLQNLELSTKVGGGLVFTMEFCVLSYEKKNLFCPFSWLLNRDPCNGLL